MQMQIFRRAVLGLTVLGLTVSMLAILSCGGSDNDNTTQRTASLTGAAERPTPRTTNGSGSAVLTINDTQSQISYTLTYTGLSNVVQAHIHEGDANTAGSIFLFLCANGTLKANAPVPPPDCPTSSGTVTGTLTEANLIKLPTGSPPINSFADGVAQILSGNSYTNIHTDDGVAPQNTGPGDFPGGEVRGQNQ